MIPRESLAKQHQFLVLDVRFKKAYRKARHVLDLKIKCWRLNGDAQASFVDRLTKRANWKDEFDRSVMWNKMDNCIRKVVKEELGKSKGRMPPCKDTLWWNEEVKVAIKNKQICYRNLGESMDTKCFEKYKLAKEATRVYNDIYDILE